jgi:hypothetical protein
MRERIVFSINGAQTCGYPYIRNKAGTSHYITYKN